MQAVEMSTGLTTQAHQLNIEAWMRYCDLLDACVPLKSNAKQQFDFSGMKCRRSYGRYMRDASVLRMDLSFEKAKTARLGVSGFRKCLVSMLTWQKKKK